MTTSRYTIAFEEGAWSELTSRLNDSVETAWVLLTRLVGSPTAGNVTLLVYQVDPVPDSAYESRESDSLSIRTNGWLPTFGQAGNDGSVPIFVHTHPNGNPHHSDHDLHVDEELARVASVRTGLGHFGSLVLGGSEAAPTVASRFKASDGTWRRIDRVRVVGEKLLLLSSADSDEESSLEIFDRQVRAFGEAGQRTLNKLSVGVVGAGGTGSAVIEQLSRLGVGEIVVIDPDTLTATNLTRVYGSTDSDVAKPKVQIADQHAAQIGLGTSIIAKQGDIRNRKTIEALTHCDVVMGCTDDNAGRMVMTRLPQALIQLFIDCGVMIDSRNGELFDIFGRVSVVTPTSACLVCMDDIDLERARTESMSDQERKVRVSEGYAPELATRDPAVITYTTITASFAVNDLLSKLFGYCEENPANRMLVRIGSRAISKMRREIRGSHRCGRKELVAIGMREPFLDYGWSDE